MAISKEESARSYAVLESSFLESRPKMLLALAKENGLMEEVVMAPNGRVFPATQYCVELYCNATTLQEEHQLFQKQFEEEINKREEKLSEKEILDARDRYLKTMGESLQIVSLLLTMERMKESIWNFGSELRFQLAAAGFPITRNETNAFLAQQGDFTSAAHKPDKGALMKKNALAVLIYAADLLTLCGTLHEVMIPGKAMPQELCEKYNACWKPTFKESMEAMLLTFAPAFLGKNEHLLKGFMNFLAGSDFYTAPASTKYHSSGYMGLSNHNCQTLARMVAIVKPKTEAEMGQLVLTVIGHDLCKINVYEQYYTNEKCPGPALRLTGGEQEVIDKYQTKYWSDGSAYHYREVSKYRFNDKLPQGHGQKSLSMLLGYLKNAITEEMAAAVDGHMRDLQNNPLCDLQMMKYPLCRYLHVADTIASLMDEEDGG